MKTIKASKNIELMTRKQTAKMLSISLTTLRAWTVQKLIKGYQLGGRIYYKPDEIIKAMKRV